MDKPKYTHTYTFKHVDVDGYSKTIEFDIAHITLNMETVVEVFKRFLLADGFHPNLVEKIQIKPARKCK
jgi:hypothetical protein